MKPINQKLGENFYTVLQFVKHVGVVSVSGTYRKMQQGIIPYLMVNNVAYIPISWVKEHYDDPIDDFLKKVAK